MRKGMVYFVTDENEKKASHPFKSSLFGKHAGLENIQATIEKSKVKMKNDPSKLILKITIETAVTTSNSEDSFKMQLREQGIATVIRKNDQGRIYGITFIDHTSQSVWNGSQISKELSANSFNKMWNERKTKPETLFKSYNNSNLSDNSTVNYHQPEGIHQIFGEFFSGLLTSDASNDQDEQIFESHIKKKKRKRKKR